MTAPDSPDTAPGPDPIRLGKGPTTYEWTDLTGEETGPGWAHHGVAVTASGRVVAFDAGDDRVLVFTPDGELVDSWPTGLVEGHGITCVQEEGREAVWIADCGQKMSPVAEGEYELLSPAPHGRVVKFDLAGTVLMELPVPSLDAYARSRYAPTAVVVDQSPAGGTGRIWVADGYGENSVHVFDATGDYLETLDGSFDCPHAMLIDRRRAEPELCIADRENSRLQVYGLDGVHRRTIDGGDRFHRPSALAVAGDLLVVAELEARLAVLDRNDQLVCHLGADQEAPTRTGWPNLTTAFGRTVRPPLQPGFFNSPHGLAVDGQGNLVVAEWLIGGRITRLRHSGS